jgi:hypothetical protein
LQNFQREQGNYTQSISIAVATIQVNEAEKARAAIK